MLLVRTCILSALGICAGLFILPGTATAGVENIYDDGVQFQLTAASAFVVGTTDSTANQVATVDLNVKFDNDPVQTFSGMTVTFSFNATKFTLIGARPSEGWGSVPAGNYNLDTLEFDGTVMKVNFLLSYTSTMPTSADWTTLAHFDFQAVCQSDLISYSLPFTIGQSFTHVRLGNDDLYYTSHSEDALSGHLSIRDYQGSLWLVDQEPVTREYEGALGTEIKVPIFVQTNFRLGYVEFSFTYQHDKLRLLGVENDSEGYFWQPLADSIAPDMARVRLIGAQAFHQLHCFYAADTVAYLRFLVKTGCEGHSVELHIYPFADAFLKVAQDVGYCDLITGSADLFSGGTISVPAYAALYSTTFPEGATLSDSDDVASVTVNLTNNFPAGQGMDNIIANLRLDPALSAVVDDPGPDFGMHVYPGANGQEVSLRLETDTFFELSHSPQPMVSFSVTKSMSFTAPTDFDDRFFPITYQTPYDNEPAYDARVIDTTNGDTLVEGDGLTWDQPKIEYLMGEYYCNPVQGGQGHVTQDYYTRSSFSLHAFRVKIVVTGAHHIYDIACQPNIELESYDDVSFKWAILKTGAGWADQAPTNNRVKFASITYAYSGGSNLQMNLDHPWPPGHWVTLSSTVAFEYDAGLGYYMNDPDGADQHEVAIGGTVVSKWWVTDPIETDDPSDPMTLNGAYGIPVAYDLQQNYPNPFNPTTDFLYGLPEAGYVEICVFNIIGQKVATLVSGWRDAGYYRATWDGSGLASGVYFYRLQVNDNVQTRKMILLK